MKDHYEIMGVPRNASSEEIRQRYRFLVQAYHPDRFPDPANKTRAEEEFKLVQAAYQVLSNPRARADYDRQQLRRPNQRPASSPRTRDQAAQADAPPSGEAQTYRPVGFWKRRTLGLSGAQWTVAALFFLNLVVRDPVPLWDELVLFVLFFTIDGILSLFGR